MQFWPIQESESKSKAKFMMPLRTMETAGLSLVSYRLISASPSVSAVNYNTVIGPYYIIGCNTCYEGYYMYSLCCMWYYV